MNDDPDFLNNFKNFLFMWRCSLLKVSIVVYAIFSALDL